MNTTVAILGVGKAYTKTTDSEGNQIANPIEKRAILTKQGEVHVTEKKLREVLQEGEIDFAAFKGSPKDYAINLYKPEFRKAGKVYKYTDANGVQHETKPQKRDNIVCEAFSFEVTGLNTIMANKMASLMAKSLGISFKPAVAQTANKPAAIVEETPEIAIDDVE